MDTSYTMIAGLSPQTDRHTILARVTRIWEAINKRSGVPLHTNIVLLDEKDDHIVATIRNNQKEVFMPKLEEGKVYSIANIKVVPGPKMYKTTTSDQSLSFFYKTKIKAEVDTGIIPLYKFDLKEFSAVKELVGDVRLLIDVIGMVKSYGRLEKRGNGAQKMDVVLRNIRDEFMVVTLWEDRAQQFLNELTPSKDTPVFTVITGLLAKKFSDAASLSSTDATRCYVNIDYAPLNALKDALADNSQGKQHLMKPPTVEQFVTNTGDIMQELPITTILETVIPAGKQAVRCICRAKIIAILDGNGWFYSCCPTCARSLKDLNGKFYCLSCEEEPEKLAERFRIVAKIEDPSGTTTVTLFNKEAEQLVGIPLAKILSDQQEEENIATIPPAVRNIIGKFCAFQIKITPYNIIQGCEEYTVTRVSEISADTNCPASTSVSKKQKVA